MSGRGALRARLAVRVALAGAIVAGMLAPEAAAGAPGNGYVLAGASVQESPSSFANLWKTGFGVTTGFGAPLLSRVELLGTFSIDRFSAEGSLGPELFGAERTDGGSTTVLLLASELRFHPTSGLFPVAPYFGGGVGLFRQTFEETALLESDGSTTLVTLDAENAFAVTAGAGFRIRITRGVRLMLDGHWVIGFTGGEQTRFVPLRIGLSLG